MCEAIDTKQVPAIFSPLMPDGSKPKGLAKAFLRTVIIQPWMLQESSYMIIQDVAWEIVLENPKALLTTAYENKYARTIRGIASFQEWVCKDNFDEISTKRIVIIREYKE